MAAENDFNLDEDRFKKLVANPIFQSRILNLRKSYGIPEDGFKDNKSEDAKKDTFSETELRELERNLYQLMSDFELSQRWYQGMRYYLFGNNPFMFRAQSPYTLKFEYDGYLEAGKKPKNVHTVWIGVDEDTTEDEVKEALKAAKDYLPKKVPYRPSYNASKAIRGRQLREAGLSWDDVAEEVNREFRSNYDGEAIRKAVGRLKNQS